MTKKIVGLTSITAPEIADYGKSIYVKKDQPADNQGNGWVCWYPLAGLKDGDGGLIGLVKSTRTEPVIRMVESHPTREEWVYAIDKPIIQVVALTTQRSEGLADINSALAIVILPGQGIIINPGVWHAPAFGYEPDEAYYGFVLAKADPSMRESGLVQFHDGFELQVDVK